MISLSASPARLKAARACGVSSKSISTWVGPGPLFLASSNRLPYCPRSPNDCISWLGGNTKLGLGRFRLLGFENRVSFCHFWQFTQFYTMESWFQINYVFHIFGNWHSATMLRNRVPWAIPPLLPLPSIRSLAKFELFDNQFQGVHLVELGTGVRVVKWCFCQVYLYLNPWFQGRFRPILWPPPRFFALDSS